MPIDPFPDDPSPIDPSKEEDQRDAAQRRARGEFVRGRSGFRHWIGDPGFAAEPGRYHLYLALNCPWCHRVALARNLLALQDSVSLDVVFPNRTDDSDPAGPNHWEFAPQRPASLTGAPLPECSDERGSGQGYRLVRQIYDAEDSPESSLPILFDKHQRRIVNNESAEILRMLDAHARPLRGETKAAVPQLYPDDAALRGEIDDLNQLIYTAINNGAYKAGFSSDQSVYAAAFHAYFEALDHLEALLARDARPFLTGASFTEADLRLFPTLFRHDPVYYLRMKLNGARMLDYPHLWRWLCRVYALPGVAEASALAHCRQGYFGRSWNRVIPLGPLHPMPYPEAYLHPELAADAKPGRPSEQDG